MSVFFNTESGWVVWCNAIINNDILFVARHNEKVITYWTNMIWLFWLKKKPDIIRSKRNRFFKTLTSVIIPLIITNFMWLFIVYYFLCYSYIVFRVHILRRRCYFSECRSMSRPAQISQQMCDVFSMYIWITRSIIYLDEGTHGTVIFIV
jgi:hypothetical protein